MNHNAPDGRSYPDYRSLGLLVNPLAVSEDTTYELRRRLVSHAAAMEALVAIDEQADADISLPIWVEKKIGSRGTQPAVAVMLGMSADHRDLGLLAIYVPIDMFRIGRIRSALSAVADRISNFDFETVLAPYVRSVLSDVDPDIAGSEQLADVDIPAILDQIDEDATGTLDLFFGPSVRRRKDSLRNESIMKLSALRIKRLEEDPTETDDDEEIDETDPFGKAFVESQEDPAEEAAELEETTTGEAETGEADESSEEASDEEVLADAVAEYVIAHTKTHLSPVIARGLLAYRLNGVTAMTQELKVTKAPKKTLRALARLACHHYRKVVIVYDRIDQWNRLEEDQRAIIAGTMVEMKFALGESAVIVLIAAEGYAPDLEAQFSNAVRVEWATEGIDAPEEGPLYLDLDLVQTCVDAALLPGRDRIEVASPIFDELVAAAGDLESFVTAAAVAFQDAAERAAGQIDERAIQAAIATLRPSDEPG